MRRIILTTLLALAVAVTLAQTPASPQGAEKTVRVVELPTVSVQHDWLDYIAIGCTALLVIIGYFGVRYAKRTLADIKRQADTMEAQAADARASAADSRVAAQASIEIAKKAADAALLHAKSLVRAERPWIVITVESDGPNVFHFKATNRGKTPAKIISIHGKVCHFRRPVPEGALQFDYSQLNDGLISTPARLLPPSDSCTAFLCNIEQLRGNDPLDQWMTHLKAGFREVFFYGKVRYFDVFESDPDVPHETTWRYWLIPFQSALPIPDPLNSKDNAYR